MGAGTFAGWAGALLLVVGIAEGARGSPPYDPANAPGGYPGVVAAVKAAADRYNPRSIVQDREHYGVVLRSLARPPRYFYTHAVGARRRDGFCLRVPVRADYQVVAVWHTHGRRAEQRSYFSVADTRTANRLQLPIYLADYTGILKVYFPGDRMVMRMRAVAGTLLLARGRVVTDPEEQVVRVRVRES